MTKSRKGRPRMGVAKRYVRCEFECPAKGDVEFNVWPRKGEITKDDACWRKLKEETLKQDPDQVRLCRKKRFFYID